ncbi:MAG: MarR family winged helix-turn-helix transcriptional regulator [Gammaproteobacteria bacterium]|jgi:DNA-binding MarR family transcriptional regulator
MAAKKKEKSVFETLYSRRPGHLIRRCQQIHVGLFLQECKIFNLTPIQFSTLNVLSHVDGIEQAALAGYVALDRSSAGEVLMRLEKRGLVKRKKSKEDGRIKLLYLTKKGENLVEKSTEYVLKAQKRMLDPLTKKEQKIFQHFLERIANFHNESSRAPLTKIFAH